MSGFRVDFRSKIGWEDMKVVRVEWGVHSPEKSIISVRCKSLLRDYDLSLWSFFCTAEIQSLSLDMFHPRSSKSVMVYVSTPSRGTE